MIDCLVIGGGPAGLAAAIQLGRLRRSCVVVDDDAGRSLWSQVTRNHLGFPNGVTAADLRILGLRQAVHYDAELRGGRVIGLRRARATAASVGDGLTGPGFVATIQPRGDPGTVAEELAKPGFRRNVTRERRQSRRIGEVTTRREIQLRARSVILASGVIDEFPAFPDRDLCVGISLFWCIVCDGYEAIGRRVAVVGDDEAALSTALGLRRFSDNVVLITNRRRTQAPADRLGALAARGIEIHRGPVEIYHHTKGQIERLVVDGADVACEMVFVSSPKRPRSRLARRLGARADPAGYLLTDAAGRTSVAGLYAVGDVTAGHAHQVTTGAHLGATAATAVNWDLYDEVERNVRPRPTGRKATIG